MQAFSRIKWEPGQLSSVCRLSATSHELHNLSPLCRVEQQAWNHTTCSSGAGFEQQVRDTNQSEVGRRNGGTMLSQQGSERALLCFFMERLHALDVDALVGHNVAAFDLDVLLHRMQHHKVGAPGI